LFKKKKKRERCGWYWSFALSSTLMEWRDAWKHSSGLGPPWLVEQNITGPLPEPQPAYLWTYKKKKKRNSFC
jgi:hypothetical protein